MDEAAIPVRTPVRAAAEMLGLDVLTLTNEGCMLIASPPQHRTAPLDVLRGCQHTAECAVIGSVQAVKDPAGPLITGRDGSVRQSSYLGASAPRAFVESVHGDIDAMTRARIVEQLRQSHGQWLLGADDPSQRRVLASSKMSEAQADPLVSLAEQLLHTAAPPGQRAQDAVLL